MQASRLFELDRNGPYSGKAAKGGFYECDVNCFFIFLDQNHSRLRVSPHRNPLKISH